MDRTEDARDCPWSATRRARFLTEQVPFRREENSLAVISIFYSFDTLLAQPESGMCGFGLRSYQISFLFVRNIDVSMFGWRRLGEMI